MLSRLFEFDSQLFLWINGLNDIAWLRYFLGWPTFLGQFEFLLAVVFGGMVVFRRKGWLKRYLAFVVIVALVHLLTSGLKLVFARPRPFDFFSPEVMSQVLFERPGTYAFPSGHGALAFAAAGLLHFFYGGAARFVYVLAFLVALSRIFIGVHYPSDVVAGALIGVFGGWLGARILRRLDPETFFQK